MISEAAALALEPYRRAFLERPLPYVEVPKALSPALVGAVHERAASHPFERFELAPRGRYDRSVAPLDPALALSLTTLASFLAGASLQVVHALWIRAQNGSYALLRDDVCPPEFSHELVLDLSVQSGLAPDSGAMGNEAPSPSGAGCWIFTHRGRPFFVATQAAGSLALVLRGPTVQKYMRYIPYSAPKVDLLRLVLALKTASG